MNERAAKIGWIGGGLGSLLFMLVLAVVWIVQGRYASAAVGMICFAAGVAILLLYAPWRFPTTLLRSIYLGFLAYYLAACVLVAYVGFSEVRQPRGWVTLARLAPMVLIFLIPVFTMGRKNWRTLQGDG